MDRLLKYFLIIFIQHSLNCAEYYVDYATGNDTNAGTSSLPFKHCPGDTNATSTAASTTLAAGDTVFLSSHVKYILPDTGIKLIWSGNVNNYIKYDGSSWGTGSRAQLSNNNSTNGGVGLAALDDKSYIYITGIVFTNIGGIAVDNSIWTDPIYQYESNALTSVPSGTGINIFYGAKNIVITNCLFSSIGQWIPEKPVDGLYQITGVGITAQNNSNIFISSCEFTKTHSGIELKSTALISDIVVTNCNFHNYMTWCIDVSPRLSGGVLSNIMIIDSDIHDYHEFDTGNWNAWGGKPHTDGIFFRTSGIDSQWYNVVVDRCYFYADEKNNSSGGTASIFISQGPSVTVRNCVFTGTRHNDADVYVSFANENTDLQVCNIYNNTFYGETRPIAITGETNTLRREVYVLNNLMFRNTDSTTGNLLSAIPLSILKVCNYNQYFTLATEETAHVFYTGGYFTLSEIKGYGYESNGFWANPGFVDISHSVTNQASLNNLHLLTISSAINYGTNLSSIFTYDKDKVTRETLWDIGAYEFINAPVHNGSANTIRANTIRVFGP